jgi:hypothetical protein
MLRFILHMNGPLCLMNVTYTQFKISAAWLCSMKSLFGMVIFDEASVMLSCSLCLD